VTAAGLSVQLPISPGGLTVVVVTYSPGKELDIFLSTLSDATARPYDVVLADNGSTDGAPEAAARRPDVSIVRSPDNIGYGAAANLGAAARTGEWIVVANPDISWQPGALDTLLEAAERWPSAGAFGPAIVTPDGALYPSARALPSLSRGIGHALAGWWWPSNPWTAAYRNEREDPREGETGWLSGSCLLLRRKAFDAVGGFDPAYFMYFEDVDLAARLADAGWASVYVPSAVVCHTGGHATARTPALMQKAHHRSAYRYLARAYPGLRWLPVRLALGAGLAARYAVARVSRRAGEGARPTRAATVLTGSIETADRQEKVRPWTP
jgi:N-acetylglucosaminyl-diphospho-decaprenol L-rhamnosyltransferase